MMNQKRERERVTAALSTGRKELFQCPSDLKETVDLTQTELTVTQSRVQKHLQDSKKTNQFHHKVVSY